MKLKVYVKLYSLLIYLAKVRNLWRQFTVDIDLYITSYSLLSYNLINSCKGREI